jgi:short subunit dehydrogenase-like uncharacterized protein
MTSVLIYGATGFTGRAISHEAKQAGLDFVVAGRNREKLMELADQVDVPFITVGLDDPVGLDQAFDDVDIVINVAGPFVDTAQPVLEACLRTQAHYLDVSGEMASFALAQQYDRCARECGIMILPGVGFVNTPSDCLAAHLKKRMPDADNLRFAFSKVDLVSRGTMRAMLSLIRRDVCIRRHGELVTIPVGRLERCFDFGEGQKMASALSWADVITAYHTTGIPNIEAYAEMSVPLRGAYQLGALCAEPLRLPPARWASDLALKVWPEGPDTTARQGKRRVIVAEAENLGRWKMASRLSLPDGYSITPPIAIRALQKVISGKVRPGFATPAKLFGAEFITEFDGVRMEDVI